MYLYSGEQVMATTKPKAKVEPRLPRNVVFYVSVHYEYYYEYYYIYYTIIHIINYKLLLLIIIVNYYYIIIILL